MKPLSIILLTVCAVTACTYMIDTEPYDSHEIQRAEYCKRVALFESTKHLPLEDIKGHSNYLGEDCEQTNN
tara:strand:+ start:732 stop:944 length:213 start_codon:yes stop_codon:yes gene_type:complete